MTDDPSSAAPPPSPPSPPAAGQVPPDLVQTLEELVEDVATQPSSVELGQRLETLVGLLIARGHLHAGHARMLRRIKGVEASTVRLSVIPDKRAVPSPDIDCASLLHLCKGRCCALRVTLSEQDLAERELEWDLQQPYLLRRDPEHGYCSYLGVGGKCGVYEARPATCRSYDCRTDPRVWIDFEQKLPAPVPWHLIPEAWLPEPDRDAQRGEAQDATSDD